MTADLSRLARDATSGIERVTAPSDRRIFLQRLAATIAAGSALGTLAGCAAPAPQAYEPIFHPDPPRRRVATLPDQPPGARPVLSRMEDVDRELHPELLPTPDLSDGQIVRTVAGLRPYRRGGVRIELDRLPDRRPIVHDYGHGGAGITLAWGSAEEVRDLLRPVLAPPASIAVLGAGIVGMTAAAVLRESGYTVTMYAEKFSPQTTSDLAGGQFAPSLVAEGTGLERRYRMERILRRSYLRYTAHLGPHYGVYRRDNYATPGRGSGLTRIPAGILPPVQRFRRLPFSGPNRRGRMHRTLLIEPPSYLPRLAIDLERAGVRRVRHGFESVGDVTALREQGIVDCLGLGARSVFNDRSLTPVRGQLLHLRPQSLPYLLSHNGYMFPRRDALVLGGSAEWNMEEARTDDRTIARILASNRAFFPGSERGRVARWSRKSVEE